MNRADDRDDRVCVRIDALIDDYVLDSNGHRILHKGEGSTERRLAEYWTLGKRDGHWILLSIEQLREGKHELDEELIATPDADTGRIRDEVLVEQAAADKADGYKASELLDVDFADDARAAALDLSLAGHVERAQSGRLCFRDDHR